MVHHDLKADGVGLPAADHSLETELTPRTGIRRRLTLSLRHHSLLLGLIICVVILILIAGAPLFTSYNPTTLNQFSVFAQPSSAHLMGADEFGRDVFARVLYGGRNTVEASFMVAVLGGFVGSALGLIAGYFGGLLGLVIMRLMDLLLVFPGILLALIVAAILGPGLVNGVLAVAIASIPVFGRVVEGATIEVRSQLYMEAATALGASRAHIMRHNVLPNVLPDILVLWTSWLGVATLSITGLGYLGLALQPPTPEWGASLNDGQEYISVAWWISFFPGLFLTLFVVGTNLVGDGLRDVRDPTLSNF